MKPIKFAAAIAAAIAATVTLAISLGTAFAPTAEAQVLGTETRLSNIRGPSYTPKIAAHGGNLHVVWWEDPASLPGMPGEIYYRRSTDGGTNWATAVNLSNTSTTTERLPLLAAGKTYTGSGSAVYVFWTDNSDTGDIFLRRSTDGGATFQAPQRLTTPDGNYSRPGSALVDSQGRVHLAWYDTRYTAGYGQVLHMLSCDNGASWTAVQFATRPISGADSEAPRLVEDSNGNLYIVLRSVLDGNPQQGWPPFGQYLMRASSVSCTTGATWQFPIQRISRGLPFDLGNAYGAKVIAGAGGRLHAAWWQESSGNNLIFRTGRPRGNGWNGWTDVSEFGPNHPEWDGTYAEIGGFAMAEDQYGALHVVMPQYGTAQPGGFVAGPLKYRKSSDLGTTWTPAVDFSSQPYTLYADGIYADGKVHVVWSDLRDQVAGQDVAGPEIYYRNLTPTAVGVGILSFTPSSVSFGNQDPNTVSTPQAVTVTNVGDTPVAVSGVTVSGPFQIAAQNCSTVGASSSCSVSVQFAPTTFGAVSGALTITSNGLGSPQTVALAGTGSVDLIEHYYLSILRRPSDAGGKAFWQSELVRMQSLSVDAKEVYYVIAGWFFNSDEYKAFNRSNSEFITDLYNTFFMRPPDSGGLNWWMSQLTAGMPRNVAMYSFMFSTEFNEFMARAIGSTPSRAEVYAVVDYYRGLLGRLPDTAGFTNWLNRFRVAHCSGAAAVNTQVNTISQEFLTSGEYAYRESLRAPTERTREYVADLYYAFLRRGGELSGFQFWVAEIDSGAETRDQVRGKFIISPEFQARVTAIIAQGCYTGS